MASSRFPTNSVIEKLGDALAIKLMGYFGSTTDGVVKVYLSLDDLSEYYEIHESDILHVEEAPTDQLPYGGSAIWVKPDARVERCVRQRISTEARFLSGEIAARMAKGPAATYNSQLRAALEPDTAACDQGSVWPCSVVWGYCLASNFPCVNTQQPGCWVIVSAQSCFTCAGDTCVTPCYSAGCPPTHGCTNAPHITQCCQIFSAKCAVTALCRK